MKKKLLIVAPRTKPGQPVAERVRAFADFFQKENIEVDFYPTPGTLLERVKLIRHIYKRGFRNVFVTMPPFRHWSLCALPRVNVILDIRDGWSVAMRTGYGGTANPTPFKANLARLIEQFAIRMSGLTITCTPGLVRYHSTRWVKNKVVLVPNGFPDHELPLVKHPRGRAERDNGSKIFICAGKFSEYGKDRTKDLISNIHKNFQNNSCHIKVYSNNKKSNFWVGDFIKESKIDNIDFHNFDAISRESILEQISASDYGIAIIRDPDYDFGTKIYDYITCGIKVIISPAESAELVKYFGDSLNGYINENARLSHLRGTVIEGRAKHIMSRIK